MKNLKILYFLIMGVSLGFGRVLVDVVFKVGYLVIGIVCS